MGNRSIGTLSALITGQADQLVNELRRTQQAVNTTNQTVSAGFQGIERGALRVSTSLLGGYSAARVISSQLREVIKDIDHIPGVPADSIASIHLMRNEMTMAQGAVQRGAASLAAFLGNSITSVGAFLAVMAEGISTNDDAIDAGLKKLHEEMEKGARQSPEYQAQVRAASDRLRELQMQLKAIDPSKAERILTLQREAAGLRAGGAHYDPDDLTRLAAEEAAARKDVETKRLRIDLDRELADAEKAVSDSVDKGHIATLSQADAIDALQNRLGRLRVELTAVMGARRSVPDDPRLEERAIQLNKQIAETQTQLNPLLKANRDWVNQLGTAFQSTFDSALVRGERLGDFLRSLAQDVIGVFGKLLVVNPLLNSIFGGVTGWKPLPSMSFHASGGSMAAGEPGIVGEQGPELFIPNTAGSILPAGPTRAAMSGGGGSGANFYIDARGADRSALAELKAMVLSLHMTFEERAIGAVLNTGTRSAGFRRALGV